MDHGNDQLINAQAAGWLARLSAADCSDDDRVRFERWLAADALHAKAYAKAIRVTSLLSAGSPVRQDGREHEAAQMHQHAMDDAATARLKKMADEALAACPDPGSILSRRWLKMAAAASFVLLGVLVVTRMAGLVGVAPDVATYQSAVHQPQQIELADGSIVYLDADSSVAVRLSAKARELTLQKGRAYFSVAHDAARPFSVTAAGTRTVALGTRFEVNLSDVRGVSVVLAQGSVAITPVDDRGQWREQLVPGQRLTVQAAGQQRQIEPVNAERAVAWSEGKLVFDGESLDEVLVQINRYSADRLVLGDTSLASMPVGGSYSVGSDTMKFVEALSEVMSLRSERVGEHEIVLFQNHSAAGTH